jgi:hypothetical protein
VLSELPPLELVLSQAGPPRQFPSRKLNAHCRARRQVRRISHCARGTRVLVRDAGVTDLPRREHDRPSRHADPAAALLSSGRFRPRTGRDAPISFDISESRDVTHRAKATVR